MAEPKKQAGGRPEDEPAPGITVRRLLRKTGLATLSSRLARDADAGWPYGSLVLIGLDHDASPLLLISDLADHTRNIKADPRVALLIDGTAGYRDRLSGPRATLLGRAERSDSPQLKARYLARHPDALVYAGFADFKLYRVTLERAHLVAGFGRIHWIDAKDLLYDTSDTAALADAEPDIVAHMNRDHGDAVVLMASVLLGLSGEDWVMTGVDPEGADLRGGTRIARLPFDHPVRDPEGCRDELVRLVDRARAEEPAVD